MRKLTGMSMLLPVVAMTAMAVTVDVGRYTRTSSYWAAPKGHMAKQPPQPPEAPEIDPASFTTALGLIGGAWLVVRGRRKA